MSARRDRRLTFTIALVAVALAALPAGAEEFSDVPTWQWAWAYVQGVRDADITTGYDDGTYQPATIVARDQMAVFIARAMCDGDSNVPDGPATATFPDVPNTGYGTGGTDPFWAYKYIEYAVEQGVVSGYDDGLYHPDWQVSRGQMAAFMARAMCGGDQFVPAPSGSPTFPDVTATENSWCYNYVEYIADEGVTTGYPDGLYHPEVLCARDQMAAYLCRAFDLPMPPQPYNITDYFPLTEGSTWTYETNEGMRTSAISGTQQVFGRTYARMVSDGGGVDLWAAAPEGLYLGGMDLGDVGAVTFDPAYQLANGLFPAQYIEEQLSTVYSGSTPIGTAFFDYYFIGVEDVTVPAGTFANCMKLRIQLRPEGQASQTFYIWAARGVGVVKMDSGDFGGDEWEVLVSADVNGRAYPAERGPFRIADYWPIEVGPTWIYSGSDGTSIDQIPGISDIGGVEAAQLAEGPDVVSPRRTFLAVIDGALSIVGMRDEGDSELVSFSPPAAFPVTASAGDSGSVTVEVYVNGSPSGQMTLEWAVVGSGPVVTGAGEFRNCLKLRIAMTDPSDKRDEAYTWLALGVGPVKDDDRPFGGDSWRELAAAHVLGVDYPTAGRLFDITDYIDLTAGNEWLYDGLLARHGYTAHGYSYGGYDWASLWYGATDAWNYNYRTDSEGLHYLGTSGGMAGGEAVRYDPPLLIENGLMPGDSRTVSTDVYDAGSFVGEGTFEHTFRGIEAVLTEAGLFPDCMAFDLTLATPVSPTQSVAVRYARSVGPVSGGEMSRYGVFQPLGSLLEASVAGVNYPPGDTTFTVTDYLPVAMGNQWAMIGQGEGNYASLTVVDGTQSVTGLGITDTIYKLSRFAEEGYQGSDLIAIRTDGIGIYGYADPVDGAMVVNPPLLIPNGAKVGDSGSSSTTMYVWATDHWQSLGAMDGFWELVAAGPVTTSAGHFRDCLLIRWGAQPPGMEEMTTYSWYARGIGVVKRAEVGDAEWEELMGATIAGETTPADIAPNTAAVATIPPGESVGFDFSAGAMAALPDDQDLSYIYNGAQDASVRSFDANGVSRFIAQGDYGFESVRAYSTFLPPQWDLWGQAWTQQSWVLGIGWDSIGGTTVVRTREGDYALVHIAAANATQLDIEYVYPYGFFAE
ncbi:MAG: S-layer homology domain-containing protein [Armatimonadota bacterium]